MQHHAECYNDGGIDKVLWDAEVGPARVSLGKYHARADSGPSSSEMSSLPHREDGEKHSRNWEICAKARKNTMQSKNSQCD